MINYIATDMNVMGGAPVIKGTRVPIEVILYLLKEGFSPKEIQQDYPQISMKTLTGAIDESIQIINTTLHAKEILQT